MTLTVYCESDNFVYGNAPKQLIIIFTVLTVFRCCEQSNAHFLLNISSFFFNFNFFLIFCWILIANATRQWKMLLFFYCVQNEQNIQIWTDVSNTNRLLVQLICVRAQSRSRVTACWKFKSWSFQAKYSSFTWHLVYWFFVNWFASFMFFRSIFQNAIETDCFATLAKTNLNFFLWFLFSTMNADQ